MERCPAATLAADRVGYSGLMAADKAGTLERRKAHRAAPIDPKITPYGTRVVKLWRPRSGTFAAQPRRKCGSGEGPP